MVVSGPLHSPTKLIRAIRPHTEDLNGKLVGNILVSSRIRMKIITRIIQWVELTRYLWVGKELVKIYYSIKNPGGADECVDALACLLALRIRVRLLSEIGRCAERRNGGAENGDAVGVNEGDHLFVCLNQSLVDLLLRFECRWRSSDVVDAFEDHRILDTWMRQYVAVDTSESVGTETIC